MMLSLKRSPDNLSVERHLSGFPCGEVPFPRAQWQGALVISTFRVPPVPLLFLWHSADRNLAAGLPLMVRQPVARDMQAIRWWCH
ncbi:MAG: hypothetical protein V3W44_07105 [Dehalococcoidales bacterium]